MTLFDAYMFIDWSATNALSPKEPSKDAIWVGELPAPAQSGETYWRGREPAFAHVRERLRRHVAEGRRVLVGFDFPSDLAEARDRSGAVPRRTPHPT